MLEKVHINQLCVNSIIIYHECVGRMEKSVPRITVWHQEACRLMANGGHEGRIFRSHPYTYNMYIKYRIICF